MQEWLKLALVVVSSGILVSVLIIIIQNSCRKRSDLYQQKNLGRIRDLQSGTAEIHRVSHHHLDGNGGKRTNYFVIRRGPPAKPIFSWADHPSLVTDAVENGWSEFGFAAYSPPTTVKSAASLLGNCGSSASRMTVEMSWEVAQGSPEFMQKIQFRRNSGTLKKIKNSSGNSPAIVKTNLPLPGPPLGNSSFPQEAYIEITILPIYDLELMGKMKEDHYRSEGEKIKLISDQFTSKTSKSQSNFQELTPDGKETKRTDSVALSVGLTAANGGIGGTFPLKLPGSYPGSVGFNSNASVFLDGMKLVQESDTEEWWGRAAERVIGCGHNPTQKKIFFTLDSQIVHEIHCNSEEYGGPLYPILAANADIIVLVNLGQTSFKFAPANLQRTQNPCFITPLVVSNSPALGFEDSKELFSMGRIDSDWLNNNNNNNNNTVNSIKHLEFDLESEGDLFEIMLDGSGKSPITLQ